MQQSVPHPSCRPLHSNGARLARHGLLALACVAGAAQAGPVNLVSNGSFESGVLGWTLSGHASDPARVIITDGVAGSAYGEAVIADNASTASPDAAGTHAMYFVADQARIQLTQIVHLAPGSYRIGFDAYAPLNGYLNLFDAHFSGDIATVNLANYNVHSSTPQVWNNYSSLVNVLNEGDYVVQFGFDAAGIPAADVVIDRVFVTASAQGGGTTVATASVPEPASLALAALGLALMARLTRQRVQPYLRRV
jgi:hypothetical protein